MKRWLGPGLVVVGIIVMLIGIAGSLGGGDATAASSTPSSTTAEVVTTSSAAPTPTTTQAPVDSSSTTRATTTSTAAATTSTTTGPPETIESFVMAHAAALEAGDRAFVLSRLHPATIDGWGETLCSAWVDREIMTLSDYILVSVNEGPVTRVFTTPAGSITIDNFYDATVSFVFSGQTFEVGGAFARIGSEIFWLGTCR